MDQQTVTTSEAPEILIDLILGDLQVKGWDRAEVSVKANQDDLSLEEQDDVVRLRCQGSCAIRLPQGATVRVEQVQGEARFKLLEDQLTINQVMGSLILRNVGESHIDSVHGELMAKGVAGDLIVERVHGNASIRDVEGACQLTEVSGNADLRDIEGPVTLTSNGNLSLRLSEMEAGAYDLTCRGNASCRIPGDASLKIRAEASTIKVKFPNESKTLHGETYERVLGGGEGELDISASGVLSLEGDNFSDEEADGDEEFAGFGPEFSQQIAHQIESQIGAQMEAMTRQLNEQMANISSLVGKAGLSPEQTEEIIQRARESSERAQERAQERMRRAQEKLERKLEMARRKTEQKAHAAEHRAHRQHGRHSWTFGWSSSNPPTPPQPPRNPASDEERLMILRMLEQKKISLEEAESLLSALEGKE
jgi:hypothetical protein